MKTKPNVPAMIDTLQERAQAILKDTKFTNQHILNDAMHDVRLATAPQEIASFLFTGKLSETQTKAAERIIVKLLAVLQR
ncbi:hypothetical protein vBYenM636_33 [Yersinia phage vB_YenM_636]|nr:hypothetical protein vBYenM12_33 [Yersinia phage vB_YenM_12]QKN86375.1 hypothetical protein vBYenM22_33 [Yersinia phage vB_YenM_22]QKN86466.1 hypothetical protein vBYenM25_33 [Yersinia phage vB_YenM_25]QKN86557.1 hypothetical protein vBYenM27_33 [Yersinia phage vB_YenM_27]QKN86648.1 hypothetical protein vBYenM39_33 [Yersinia phage vB_YenM_39]QKN86739.1 hypothetical protein vBYenM126_33 [Yersinia phage vB_YenM_126]QKN86830.1 hypothetical protein vBYenM526-1_33 [Yersinia phage vB_YenM_526-1]